MTNKDRLLHICPFFQYEPDIGLAFEPREHDWTEIEYWETIARWAERGRFDAIFFADFWGAARDPVSIRYGKNFPMLDPLLLVSRLSAVAEHLGFIVTMSTSFYNPYMVARKLQTLNHITNGRIGWNIVTSVNQKEADQLGVNLPDHSERYARAYEYVDLVKQLWSSWEPDAVINDYDRKQISDPEKVHRVDFEGHWFQSAGPLAVHRHAAGNPVLVQAGSSPEGVAFAGQHAEIIFGPGGPTPVRKGRVDKWRSAVSDAGRDPQAVKILFPIGGCVAQSRSEAEERAAQIAESVPDEVGLNMVEGLSGFDLLKYPVDTEISDILDQVTGIKGLFNMAADKGFTILDVARFMTNQVADKRFVGTPQDVADSLEADVEEVGADGYMFRASYYAPHYVRDMATLLIPELQRRGRMRQSYGSKTLRSYLAEQ
ncbi:MAG: NtaA/DmoA family FMN-dependent monooxygenase [Chloroflexota bacterium]